MLTIDSVIIQQLVVHHVGNAALEDGVQLSEHPVDLTDDQLKSVVKKYFLTPFSGNEMYAFQNEVGLEQNEVYTLAQRIFENPDVLYEQSKLLAQHLYKCSQHPKIKDGELFVAYFTGLVFRDKRVNAIGIFKSETKNDFLKVNLENTDQPITWENGTNVNKLDKGCLVFDLDDETGYQVCIIDNLNKANEAVYWKENFLSVRPLQNEYHQTNEFLDITKAYVKNQVHEDFEVSKTDKIDLLNRSVNYFKTHEVFDKEEFEGEVLGDEAIIDSFRNFDSNYRQEREIDPSDTFDISETAVKKQARTFKSVLKLDKNFHIYIHGDRNLIQSGIDPDGRKYYKVYYEEET
ncbi:MAG: nucleoid-associated protein [Cryomorphaceae bacterium]|nr:nucleoid-associated protein [Cryomorphaceae bacterium]